VWNAAQTDATRLRTGTHVPVTIDGKSVAYRVPNEDQCAECHAKDHHFEPLGPRTEELNRDEDDVDADAGASPHGAANQIDALAARGLVDGPIPAEAERPRLVDPFGDAALDVRARSYLDANCAHCHRPGGEAASTGLDLRFSNTQTTARGLCKSPVAAGPGAGNHKFDIVPGDPDASIVVYRMSSLAPEIKMPQLPNETVDTRGVALIRAWIASLSGGCP
jgi:uncharacterized repeat protein (TIGR03806 family)